LWGKCTDTQQGDIISRLTSGVSIEKVSPRDRALSELIGVARSNENKVRNSGIIEGIISFLKHWHLSTKEHPRTLIFILSVMRMTAAVV
jgi:hypothetical protein